MRREFLPGHWRRHMFIAHGGKAVVRRHKEIVPGHVRGIIEGRPVDDHGRRDGVPLFLDGRLQLLPGSNGTKVHLLLLQLCSSTRKAWCGPLPVEALSIAVVESKVPDGAIAVLYGDGWFKTRHTGGDFGLKGPRVRPAGEREKSKKKNEMDRRALRATTLYQINSSEGAQRDHLSWSLPNLTVGEQFLPYPVVDVFGVNDRAAVILRAEEKGQFLAKALPSRILSHGHSSGAGVYVDTGRELVLLLVLDVVEQLVADIQLHVM